MTRCGEYFCAAVFGLLTLASAAASAAPDPGTLGGRPFTDPASVTPMPDDWVKAPIRHLTPKPVALALSLDQQLYPALLPLVQRFARERKVEIAIEEGTCGTSTAATYDRTADIIGACCPPAETDRLPGIKFHTVGIAAVALLVHPDNPLDGVTDDAARKLFGGQIKNWGEMPMSAVRPGPRKEVQAVTRLHCKTRPGHWRLILDNEELFTRDTEEVSAIEDMIVQVSRNRGAIGYETLYHAALFGETRKAKVRAVKVNGHDPRDDRALAAGKYPFYRVFNITTWTLAPASKPLADELAAWLIDQANAGVMDPRYGIVPAKDLRDKGWKFLENELIGEPN
ncbi:MAG: substrate-binding domain-containing protein [Magnetospirillum sp. WYHS-4]